MKKLPPYGAKLEALLKSEKKPLNDIFCFCGLQAWQRAVSSAKCRLTLCLPFQDNPFDYKWPVQDCDILLYETGGMQPIEIEKFAYCLLLYKAQIVRLVTSNYTNLFIYRGSLQ